MEPFLDQVEPLKASATAALRAAADLPALEQARTAYLGTHGSFTALTRQLGTLSKEQRPAAGKLINQVKVELEALLAERRSQLEGLGWSSELAPDVPKEDRMRWYVIHTYSGFENKVKSSLEQRIREHHMEDRFSEILIPTEEVVDVRDGKKITKNRRSFPGYVLVKMEMTNETWLLVRNTPKVSSFVGGKKPDAVSQKEVDAILGRVEVDQEKRKGIIDEIQRYCSDQMIYVPAQASANFSRFSLSWPWVRNARAHRSLTYGVATEAYAHWWLDEEKRKQLGG